MLLNEKKIITGILSYALDKGLSVSVNDGEEDTLDYSTDINEIFEALDTTGDDRIYFHDASKKSLGFYWLIYDNGNCGLDVIADASVSDLIDEIDGQVVDPILRKLEEAQ
jgi:hypothetical protein